MKKIIGMDIDGVLANWNKGARQYFIDAGLRDVIPNDQYNPPVWNWPEHYGYTKDECKKAYAAMAANEFFWTTLEPLPYCLEMIDTLNRLQQDEDADVYFITTRPGVAAKFQTECWLMTQGMDHPTVVIALSPKAKAAVASGVGLTHAIDDRWENCLEMKLARPEMQVFCLSAGWNLAFQDQLRGAGVIIVQDLPEYIEALTK